MANFQVPLNGSNFINQDRQKAFQKALKDQHRINIPQLAETRNTPPRTADPNPGAPLTVRTHQRSAAPGPESPTARPAGLDQALEHTFTHQARTMEIHQLYLAQQAENIQLITAVLTQQGKVLDTASGTPQAQIIETFQRTLDNFHAIREQSLTVHHEFLAQQADFSERYLAFLENSGASAARSIVAPDRQIAPPAEWVVHVPSIVLDEHTVPQHDPEADEGSGETLLELKLTDPGSTPKISNEELASALLNIVAEKTGYPPEMLELSMDLEADLGIDSIKRVEILGALEDKYPTLPSADTEVLAQTRTLQEIVDYMESETGAPAASITKVDINPAEQETRMESSLAAEASSEPPAKETVVPSQESKTASISVDELTAVLLEIVAEKTGYPAEMLEAEMDMEADLGIDSIKRVEILGAMEERVPGLPSVEAETLAELRTLGQIADLMTGSSSSGDGSLSAVPEEKKKVKSVDLQNTPVELLSLAAPDRLDILIPTEQPVIVTNEGTAFTEQVVHDLTANGWKVAVWDYPTNLIKPGKQSFGADIKRLKQESPGKTAIDLALDSFRQGHVRFAGLIHLHPLSAGSGLFSEQEQELMKQLFLAAGSLKSDFEEADPGTRAFFLTVTRTDGVLGMENQDCFQEGSGLTGLAKSLSWEWPEVFCRAIDLDCNLKDDHASHLLLQELHDPDQGLLEVGRSASARVTLVRKNG